MGLPSINIVFRSAGIASIKRSEKGTVAMIVRDAAQTGVCVLTNVTEIPEGFGAKNRAYIKRAFDGYITPPRKVIVYALAADASIEDALAYFAAQSFDYLVGPADLTNEEAQTIASWVKSERLENHTAKAVLPNVAADHEGVINFVTDGIQSGDTAFTTEEYCARIAGLIAGTPMKISCTYAPLAELSSVEQQSREALDTAIDEGKFTLFYDGEKVKVGRAVNSLVTTVQDKGDAFKKIKIVEAMDMIRNDIRVTAQDNYIGKYANSYDNKCLLMLAIKGYLEELEMADILEKGTSVVDIDIDAQENYLKKQGIDTSNMREKEIRYANTGSFVFLKVTVSILDAIEDIQINVTI